MKDDMNVRHGIYGYNVKTPQECFLTRVSQNIIRGSARNCGINA
jgi:hypothetical protein